MTPLPSVTLSEGVDVFLVFDDIADAIGSSSFSPFSVVVVVPFTLLGVSTVTTVLSFATAAAIVPADVADSRFSVSR